MGIVSQLVAPSLRANTPNALNDFWYSPVTSAASSGVNVTEESALKISAVWACVGLIADMMGMMPLHTYEELADDDRQRAKGYYLYDVLRYRPNAYQTPFDFKCMMTIHLLLRGNGYSLIRPTRRGFAGELLPIHPDAVTVQYLRSGVWTDITDTTAWAVGRVPQKGEIRYQVRQHDGTATIVNDDDMFHVRGYTKNGITGMSMIKYGLESMGLALAAESYGSRFYSQDGTPGGVLEHDGPLTDQNRKDLIESWNLRQAGLGNAHKTAVLPQGVKWHQISISPEDAQALETRKFQIQDIARWFRVPLHLIQDTEKSTSWGTGIEELGRGFVAFTLGPWMTRWEEAISRDLIVETGRYYAEFMSESLVKGDIKTRYEAYAQARLNGWMNANEIRKRENMPPIKEDWGEAYWTPANMVPADKAGQLPPAQLPPAKPPARGSQLFLREAAARLVRREFAAINKAAKNCKGDDLAWEAALDEFYCGYAELISYTLQIERHIAETYVIGQREMLAARGPQAIDDWETDRAAYLVALVEDSHVDD